MAATPRKTKTASPEAESPKAPPENDVENLGAPTVLVVGHDGQRRAASSADIVAAGDTHAIMIDGQRLALSEIGDYKKPADEA